MGNGFIDLSYTYIYLQHNVHTVEICITLPTHKCTCIWQGVNIVVTVWDQDPQNPRIPYEKIDVIKIEYFKAKDGNFHVLTQSGLRTKLPSQ